MPHRFVETSSFTHFFVADRRSSLFWLLVRLWLGYQWLMAGWEKLHDAAWLGSSTGAAMTGFINGALGKTSGLHPDVQWWYADFLRAAVLPHPVLWSYLITFGELAVGLGLIFGCFTASAAFFGGFMDLNFLLSGAVSLNPIMLLASIGIMISRRASSFIGVDYFLHKWFRSGVHMPAARVGSSAVAAAEMR